MTVSQKILKTMEEKNITQKKLADYTGISTSAISDWKKKSTSPSINKIGAIADCLGVSVDYLLGREQQPQTSTVNNQINTGGGDNHSTVSVSTGTTTTTNNNNNHSQFDETTLQVAEEFRKLDFKDKIQVMSLIAELSEKKGA